MAIIRGGGKVYKSGVGSNAKLVAAAGVLVDAPATGQGGGGSSGTGQTSSSVAMNAVTAPDFGLLTVDGTYMKAPNGKRVFLMGSHTWTDVQDITNSLNGNQAFDNTAFLSLLDAEGGNFIRGWTWDSPVDGGGTVGTVSPFPWVKSGNQYDLSTLDQTFFDRCLSRAQAAAARNKYISFMLFNGTSMSVTDDGKSWQNSPFKSGKNINGINGDPNNTGNGNYCYTQTSGPIWNVQTAFVDKMVATLGNQANVTFEIGNEFQDDAPTRAWQVAIANYTRNKLASTGKLALKVMISAAYPVITSNADANAWMEGTSADLFSIAGTESLRDGGTQSDYRTPNEPKVSGGKPKIYDTDHAYGVVGYNRGGDGNSVWHAFCSGYAGFWNMDDLAGQNIAGSLAGNTGLDSGQHATAENSVRTAFTQLSTLLAHVDLTGCAEHSDLANGTPCLANPATGTYVVFAQSGGNVVLDLSGAGSRALGYQWLDLTGSLSFTAAQPIASNASSVSFTAPTGAAALIVGPATAVVKSMTVTNPGSQMAGSTITVSGTLSNVQGTPTLRYALNGGAQQAFQGTPTIGGGTYSGQIALPNTAGNASLVVYDTTDGISTGSVSFQLNAAQQGGGTSDVPGAIYVGPTRTYQQFADALAAAPSGATIIADPTAAVQTKPATINKPITIQGAGAYTTLCDGQGGAGSGHPLAQGKGFFLVNSGGVHITKIGFVRCGGADGTGDAEAAIRAAGFASPGELRVDYCRFDGNEDAAFGDLTSAGTGAGGNVTLTLEHNEFGRYASNANTNTGNTHDNYVNSDTVNINYCTYYGCNDGHNVKARARHLNFSNNYFRQGQGRWLEMPDGGTGLSGGSNIFVQAPGAEQNMLGYADEMVDGGSANPLGAHSLTFASDTFYFGTQGTNVWAGQGSVVFNNCIQNWLRYSGQSDPSINLVNTPTGGASQGGTISGLITSPPNGTAFLSAAPAPPDRTGDSTVPPTIGKGYTNWFTNVPTSGTQGTALTGGTLYRADGIATPYAALVTSAAALGQAVGAALVGSAVALTETSNNTPDSLPTIMPAGSGSLALAMLDGPTGAVLALSPAISVAAAQSGGGGTSGSGSGSGGPPAGAPGNLPAFRVKAVTNQAAGAPITFGQFFVKGAVPSGSFQKLTATAAGQTAAVQTDGHNTWPDGSLRYANVSLLSPVAIAAGGVASFQLGLGSVALSGSRFSPAQLAAAGNIQAKANGGDFGGDSFTVSAGDVLSSFAQWTGNGAWGNYPLGGWEVTRDGPICTEYRAWRYLKRDGDGASHRWVKAKIYHRAWSDGQGGIQAFEPLLGMVQENSYDAHPSGSVGDASVPYAHAGNVSLYNGGSQVTAFTGPGGTQPKTYPQRGWWGVLSDGRRPWVSLNGAAQPSYMIAHDPNYLVATRCLPPMDIDAVQYQPQDHIFQSAAAQESYTINVSNFPSAINASGDDNNDKRYGCYGNVDGQALLLNPFDFPRQKTVLAYGWSWADWEYWSCDERTGQPVNMGTDSSTCPSPANPSFCYKTETTRQYGSPPWIGLGPQNSRHNFDYGFLMDSSHMPNLCAVPLLRTGDAAFEEMQIGTANGMLGQGPGDGRNYGSYENVIMGLYQLEGQERGGAHFIRQFGQCDRSMRDNHPMRGYVKRVLQQNSNALLNGVPGSDPTLGSRFGIFWEKISDTDIANNGPPNYGGAFPRVPLNALMGLHAGHMHWVSGDEYPGYGHICTLMKPILIDLYDKASGGGGAYDLPVYEPGWSSGGTVFADLNTVRQQNGITNPATTGFRYGTSGDQGLGTVSSIPRATLFMLGWWDSPVARSRETATDMVAHYKRTYPTPANGINYCSSSNEVGFFPQFAIAPPPAA